MTDESLCHRCGAILQPGRGTFYVVRIESFADPSPPHITREELQQDLSAEIDRLLDEMRNASERELMDQVYRRLTLTLCRNCHEAWIENPTGG